MHDEKKFDHEDIYDFDYAGNLVKHEFRNNADFSKVKIYEFDVREKSFNEYEITESGEREIINKFFYDRNKRKTKHEFYSDGIVVFTEEYFYDSDNRINQVKKIYWKDNDQFVTDYYYDMYSCLYKKETRQVGGKHRIKFVYDYDKDNNLISEQFYGPDGEISDKTTYNHDDGIRIRQRMQNGKIYYQIKTYYKDNLPVRNVISDSDYLGHFTTTTEFSYDEHDNVIEEIVYRPDGSRKESTEYTYEYYQTAPN